LLEATCKRCPRGMAVTYRPRKQAVPYKTRLTGWLISLRMRGSAKHAGPLASLSLILLGFWSSVTTLVTTIHSDPSVYHTIRKEPSGRPNRLVIRRARCRCRALGRSRSINHLPRTLQHEHSTAGTRSGARRTACQVGPCYACYRTLPCSHDQCGRCCPKAGAWQSQDPGSDP
jgi:hypothetical protein